MFKYIWLLIFLAAGLFTLKEEFYRKDYAEFDREVFRFLYFFCLVLAIVLIWTWYKSYRINKNTIAFFPISVPLLFIGLVTFIIIQRNNIRRVPPFLIAGFETIVLEFRVDSTYRLRINEEFSGESYYGEFKIHADTIILAKSLNQVGIYSQRLLISKAAGKTISNSGAYIFQLDKDGLIIDSSKKLPIRMDKRKVQ